MHEELVIGLVTLVVLGTLCQLIAFRARLPSILLLLACGALVGPGLGWVEPHALLGEVLFPLVSLGAAVVLFEGGMTARPQDLKEVRTPVGRLVSVGLVVTWVATSLAARFVLELSWSLSILLGAILVVTGPTVIGPLLRQARPGGNVGRILKFEGIINDPIGAILALIVFEVIQVERTETAALLIFWGVVRAALTATVLGLVGAWVYAKGRVLGWIPAWLENAALLALVLAVFALSNHVQGEAGLLAVTVMGMSLASREDIDLESNIEFAEHLRTILISVLFILLTARIRPEDLSGLSWGAGLFVLLLVVAIRPLAVFLSTWRTPLSLQERSFLALVAPRGIVAAAVASVFAIRLSEDGFQGAERLLPLTFLVIAFCVVFYGLAARPLARLLRLADPPKKKVLIVGTNALSRAIASGLDAVGVDVVMIGEDRSEVLRLRQRGFETEYGHVRSPVLLDRIEFGNVGLVLALTPSDDTNQMALIQVGRFLDDETLAYVDVLGQASTTLHPEEARRVGRNLVSSYVFEELERRAAQGEVRVTSLTEAFSFSDYVAHHGSSAIPLFVLSDDSIPRLYDEDSPPTGAERVVALVTDQRQDERTEAA